MRKTISAIIAVAIALGLTVFWFFPIEMAAAVIGAVVVLTTLVVGGFKAVPANCFAELRIFGRRLPTLYEGWVWCPPIIGSLKTFSVVPGDIPDKASFTTGNNQKLLLPFYVKCRVDEKLLDENGRNTYLGNDPEQVLREIKAEIESKLDALGGIETSDDIKKNLKPIEDYLRCSFQMSRPPHTTHSMRCTVTGCKLPGGPIPNEMIIEYYRTHWQEVGDAVKDEVNHSYDHSPLEERCGIDMLLVRLKAPEYTLETEKALEAEEQEKARARAVDTHVGVLDKIKVALPNLPDEEIADYAQVLLLPTVKKGIDAFRGSGGQPVVLKSAIPGLGGGGGKGSKDDGGGRKGGRR